MNCDVLVLGGGAAGVAAAVTAARQGAKVVLLERNGMLGGMATAALVHTVCGLYLLREEPGPVLAHPGFPTEFAHRLIASGAAMPPVRMGRVDVLPHSPPGFAMVADSFVGECPGLNVFLHSEVFDVAVCGNSISEVRVVSRGAQMVFRPKAAVDASGDALLVSMAGHRCELAPVQRLQRPAFIFALHGVDVSALSDEGRLRLAREITSGVQSGLLDRGVLGAHFRVTGRGSEVYVTIDLAAPTFDPRLPEEITRLEQTGRSLARQLFEFLRESCAAFVAAQIASLPARVGIRESRRIFGRATITVGDIISGARRGDVVALSTWPIESREKATGPRWRFPSSFRAAQIGIDALRPAMLENCWAGGRCISCDHEAQAAIRVIGTCMATGQAAGAAAALFAANGSAPTAAMVRAVYGMEESE
jgi:hypothetical protein